MASSSLPQAVEEVHDPRLASLAAPRTVLDNRPMPPRRPDLPRRPARALSALAVALLAWVGLAACASSAPVHFSSDPPGARVLIDGVDSGFVTPCLLELPNVPTRRVDFQLLGHQPATRYMHFEHRGELIYWRDASVHYRTWNFPLWLNPEDLFLFYENKSGESPSRIYVRLRRQTDS